MNFVRLLIPLAMILLVAPCYVPLAFADNNPSSGIEKIVVTPDSVQTVYYKNGTIHHYLTISGSVNLNIGVSSGAAQVLTVMPPPFPIDEIAEIVEHIIEGVFGSLGVGAIVLATEILILLRNLKRNRPKDYHGVKFSGLHIGHWSSCNW